MSRHLPKSLGPETTSEAVPATAEEVNLASSIAERGKPVSKAENQRCLDIPSQAAFTRTSDTFSDRSVYSADNQNERRTARLLTVNSGLRLASTSPAPVSTLKCTAFAFWARNKGLALVTLAQLFGVMMNVTTRLLEMDGKHGPGMHPFQVSVEQRCIS